MKIQVNQTVKNCELQIIAAYSSKKGIVISHWDKAAQTAFKALPSSKNFKGEKGTQFEFSNKVNYLVVGLGEKDSASSEDLRKLFATIYKSISSKFQTVSINLDHFAAANSIESALSAVSESIYMTNYSFDKHKSKKVKPLTKTINIETKSKSKKLKPAAAKAKIVAESIHMGRDFMNEAPNVLHSVEFAKQIEKDAKTLKNVKVKILNKAAIKKEKMGMLLSVNAGSAYEPRVVHLTYTPKKVTKKTKHVAFVGKGLTFDTGGYSLKPSASMATMKYDMGGAATVYAAFRAAVLTNADTKVSCFIGMTDNAVNSLATMPDSIVKARNGKTVEILNTDAEGRLVLGDVLDYACDYKPDYVIDCATLTGAILVALGNETCGLFSNCDELSNALTVAAGNTDERIWRLPIIEENRKEIKSPNADLKNMGNSRFGGSSKAAAFLEEFVKNDVSWAHLDVAGVASDQSHLPYCPAKGGSGMMVRTLLNFVENA